jgi:CBS domain containing-hemolysin-like protein
VETTNLSVAAPLEPVLNSIAAYWQSLADTLAFDSARLGDADVLFRIGLQVFLLFCSAFFSGSETALFSLSRLDLQQLRKRRDPRGEKVHELLDQPRRLIISILSGNELVNIAAAANMAGLLTSLYGSENIIWINLFVMVPLLLLFGEVTPKTIAVSNPVRFALKISANYMSTWVKVSTPFRWLIRGIADRTTTLFVGNEKAADNILQADEFRSLVEAFASEGELDATERAIIHNLLEAGDTEIVEIMTPRTRINFLDSDMPMPEMIAKFREYRNPRVPVYRYHRDNLAGFLHAEDVLRMTLKSDKPVEEWDLNELLRPAVVVPPTKLVDEMLDFYQNKNARAAIVLNEFGGVDGMVTLKDVLTFIFGQITGEAPGQDLYDEQDENSYYVAGEMKLTDFNNLTNFGIEDPRMTTVGGVIFRHLDRLPKRDDAIQVEGVVMRAIAMDAHRIKTVHAYRGDLEEEQKTADEPDDKHEAEELGKENHEQLPQQEPKDKPVKGSGKPKKASENIEKVSEKPGKGSEKPKKVSENTEKVSEKPGKGSEV